MNRRDYLKSTAALAAAALLPGCEPEQFINTSGEVLEVPEFSPTRLHAALDRLLAAYESKGMRVSETLSPPIPEDELRSACDWFPGELPPEIVALYGWRGGHEEVAWGSKAPFLFRDNSFCNIERARRAYDSMMSSYGSYSSDGRWLKYSFPFAEFDGAQYVLPARGHPFNASLKSPVISVFEGIDVYFYSLEKMVNTCIDWVSHPEYSEDYSLPEKVEMDTWRKHNPGIFVY